MPRNLLVNPHERWDDQPVMSWISSHTWRIWVSLSFICGIVAIVVALSAQGNVNQANQLTCLDRANLGPSNYRLYEASGFYTAAQLARYEASIPSVAECNK